MPVPLMQVQTGKETVFGTEVDSTVKLMGLTADAVSAVPRFKKLQRRYVNGNYSPAHRVMNTFRSGSIELGGDVNTADILYVLSSGVLGGISPTGAGSDKTWTFPFMYATTPTAVESRTIEITDGLDPYTFTGCVCTDFTLSGSNADDGMMQFRSTWEAQNYAAKAITAALADRTVSYMPSMRGTLSIDALGGTIGTTAFTAALLDWQLTVKTGIYLKRRQSGQIYPAAVGFMVPDIALDLTLENTAAVKTEVASNLSNAGRLVRVFTAGYDLITGAIYHSLQVDVAGDMMNDLKLWDTDNDDTTVKLQIKPRYDAGAFAGYAKIVVVNALAAMV